VVLEDFTTYTEIEEDDRIQATANHIDYRIVRYESYYLYYDKEEDHFGSNWEHLIDAKWNGVESGSYVHGGLWMLSNELGDQQTLTNTDKTFITLRLRAGTSQSPNLWDITESYDGSHYTDAYGSDVTDMLYFRIKKVGTAFTCKIYDTAESRDAETSDEHLLDTLTLTLHADHNFRYIYGVCSNDDGATGRYAEADIENFDLQEVPPVNPSAGSIVPIVKGMGLLQAKRESILKPFTSRMPKFSPRVVI